MIRNKEIKMEGHGIIHHGGGGMEMIIENERIKTGKRKFMKRNKSVIECLGIDCNVCDSAYSLEKVITVALVYTYADKAEEMPKCIVDYVIERIESEMFIDAWNLFFEGEYADTAKKMRVPLSKKILEILKSNTL